MYIGIMLGRGGVGGGIYGDVSVSGLQYFTLAGTCESGVSHVYRAV